eukprot:TRINITY_DN3344_c0_g1_i5.p1 TRINITY_DN3344_c0_g1~~TRINITY_DN3344_c0_g1_i5.p1  ORF type:complete len:358 (+),score=73.36 TRINITY_DN3344_c0_g1_i5:180-1253(+)
MPSVTIAFFAFFLDEAHFISLTNYLRSVGLLSNDDDDFEFHQSLSLKWTHASSHDLKKLQTYLKNNKHEVLATVQADRLSRTHITRSIMPKLARVLQVAKKYSHLPHPNEDLTRHPVTKDIQAFCDVNRDDFPEFEQLSLCARNHSSRVRCISLATRRTGSTAPITPTGVTLTPTNMMPSPASASSYFTISPFNAYPTTTTATTSATTTAGIPSPINRAFSLPNVVVEESSSLPEYSSPAPSTSLSSSSSSMPTTCIDDNNFFTMPTLCSSSPASPSPSPSSLISLSSSSISSPVTCSRSPFVDEGSELCWSDDDLASVTTIMFGNEHNQHAQHIFEANMMMAWGNSSITESNIFDF